MERLHARFKRAAPPSNIAQDRTLVLTRSFYEFRVHTRKVCR
jgi:hypothetical protein